VAYKSPLEELNVKLVPVFGAWLPVAEFVNTKKFSVSEDSSATVIFEAVIPVRLLASPYKVSAYMFANLTPFDPISVLLS